jgi:hypothetical protein
MFPRRPITALPLACTFSDVADADNTALRNGDSWLFPSPSRQFVKAEQSTSAKMVARAPVSIHRAGHDDRCQVGTQMSGECGDRFPAWF